MYLSIHIKIYVKMYTNTYVCICTYIGKDDRLQALQAAKHRTAAQVPHLALT